MEKLRFFSHLHQMENINFLNNNSKCKILSSLLTYYEKLYSEIYCKFKFEKLMRNIFKRN